MAAPQKYPTAHLQLRELAELALLDGTPFDVFWERAVRPGRSPVTWASSPPPDEVARILNECVIWPRDTFDRNVSMVAILDSREAWRRAYEGVPPTRFERALIVLAPVIARLGAAEPDRGLPGRSAVPSAA